ncbi:MAG TPA: hypothetical protein VN947_01375 [Polyangia bacterium]|nr:hypothetical protein [Polyangia bacterium]
MARFALVTAAFALLGLAGCGPGTGGGPVPPPMDTCTAPVQGSVDTLVIGAGNPADLSSGTASPFAPLHDGDGMTPVRGGQGATMLGFVLAATGSSVPSCLEQQTLITDGSGGTVTQSLVPLTTYAQPDGSHATHAMWMPASYPQTFVVSATAGGQTVSLHLHLAQ